MKFGLLILLWLIMFPLLSQNCAKVDIPPIRYFEVTEQGDREIHSYLVPCSNSKDLKFIMPSSAIVGYIDPDPSTFAGILLVVMKRDPGKEVLTITEFEDLMYRDVNGAPLYFKDPSMAIPISELMNLGNISNEFVLMPVMASNITGMDPTSWFEEDCVKLFRNSGVTLINNPKEGYEFIHFDEIIFTNWPADTSIADFFDFAFTDQTTGEEIPYVMSGNRSFKLKFNKSEGVFKFEMSWKHHECSLLEIGVNWAFPTVDLSIDTVAGFRDIDKCVPVHIRNFEAITGFYITFSWHPDSLLFSEIQKIHPALLPYLEIIPPKRIGYLEKMGFKLPANLDTLTLPDGVVLFEWCGKPLSESGNTANLVVDTAQDETGFDILGLEANNSARNGGIFVQEDREIQFELVQQCVTRSGQRGVQLFIDNDEAYPYTYSFHSTLVKDSILDSVPFLIPHVPAGTYQFTIRDSFGFEITESIVMEEEVPPGFELQINVDEVIHPTCLNPMAGQIGVSVLPDDENYQLELLNNTASFDGNIVSGLGAGLFIIEAEDDSGCIDSLAYTLKIPREIDVQWDSDQLVLCPGDNEISLVIEDSDPISVTVTEFQIDGGPVHEISEPIKLAKPGDYRLNLWNEDGCTLDTLIQVRAGPNELQVWDTASIHILSGDTLLFTSPSTVGLANIMWQYESRLVGETENFLYVPGESGTLAYSASVYGKCHYTDSLYVQVIRPNMALPEFEFPNVFTPNGDGVNDLFRIYPTKDIQQVVKMEVFDRYGNYIYKENYSNDSNNQSVGWNGYHAGLEVPPGIYAVQVQLLLRDGREEHVGFDVLLIR